MILVTIGTQAPFDRLIKIIDDLAIDINEPVIAQVYGGQYQPHNINTVDFLSPKEFEELFEKARIIISHAGMGTIISALFKEKPIIIFPRLASFQEHRNELGYAYVAYDQKQLKDLLLNNDLKVLHRIGETASTSLIQSIEHYIETI